jgi:hypothetical protein
MLAKSANYFCALTFIVLVARSSEILAENAPPPPPEVKKTVDAFAGHWTLTGSATEPDTKSASSVKATMDCKPAALGAAVNCLVAADISGSRIEAVAVIGYSPDERSVRWMEISSSGEYHNHRGAWRGETIQFEPLSYTVMGVKMIEYFMISFQSPDNMDFKATTKTPEGTSRLKLVGTRVSPASAAEKFVQADDAS